MTTHHSPEHLRVIEAAVSRGAASGLPQSWISTSMTMGFTQNALNVAVDTAIQLHALIEKKNPNGKT